MIEKNLLKTLLDKEQFEKYLPHLDLQFIKEQSNELYYIYTTLIELHESITRNLTLEELFTYFFAKYPDAKEEVYKGLFEDIASSELGADIGASVIDLIHKRKLYLELSEKAYAASQGRANVDDLTKITKALQGNENESDHDGEVFVTTDLDEILSDTIQTPGIRFHLNCLCKALGSLRKGDFGFIFARPETGKTTFIAALVGNALDQIEAPIVWFNNEESGKKVMLRVYQAYFKVTQTELLGNAARYKQLFKERVGNKFLLVDNPSITKEVVEKILQRVKPSLIIYDQIDKIKGFKADRDDLVYGAIYQWARENAKIYAPSIGVCQADGTAEGQKWLHMGHVSNAKTSKQAEADWILGIGKTSLQDEEYVRYLNISKNKLVGDTDHIEELRHGRFEVLIQPQIAAWKDIVNYD